jgi:tRNA-dihydrouridine synthase 1
MTVSKKEKKRREQEAEQAVKRDEQEVRDVGLEPGGRVEEMREGDVVVEEPRDGLVSG